MSAGICRVDPRTLAEALHMPEGTVIDNAQWDIHDESLWLRVRHPSIPVVPEGCPLFPVHLVVTCHYDAETPDRVARTYEGEWQ